MLKRVLIYSSGVFLILLTCFISLNIGQYKLGFMEIVNVVLSDDEPDVVSYIILEQRLPRIILGVFVGAGLSISGVAFQSLFRNPLATPDILGVSASSSFGAIIALLMGLSFVWVGLFGVIFGAISLALIILISKQRGETNTVSMILSGIIIGALFQSLISLLKYTVDPQDDLPKITYFLLGSLNYVNSSLMLLGMVGISVGMIYIFLYKWKLNLLLLSDEEAKSLGLNISSFRICVILANVLIVACSVGMCGIIGWVGLLVSHISRLLVGAQNAKLIPLSAMLGAIFLVIVDTVSRTISTEQIPISILTSIIGAPFFIFILYKTKGVRL